MTKPKLYRGVWPQNVSKLAKYGVRFLEGTWKITVLFDAGDGLRFLAVEGASEDLASRINVIKSAVQSSPGGAFYLNEYRHVIVPVAGDPGSGANSHYYYAGRLDADLTFTFEGLPLTTKPIRADGLSMAPGDKWIGPRPGIPYVLAAGASDIYYETPALTDSDPPQVRPSVTRKVVLSKVLADRAAASNSASLIARVRGHQGGRFYVNEHGAAFTPVSAGDGNGLDYVYCGQIDREKWFPEPPVD